MKLAPNQLKSHLERGLAGIYLVAADEPLLVGEAGDFIRAAAREQGFDERSLHFVERGFRWENLSSAADSLSLFASRRIIELRLDKPRPGDAGAKAIRALAEDQDPDRLILVLVQSRLDASAARSVWVKTIEKHGVVVDIRPVTRSALPQFIAARAKRHGLRLTTAATDFLAERVEGNLLAADQELAKLALIHQGAEVDADSVRESVASSARFDIFRLSDAVIDGDLHRAITVLEGLKAEGVQPPLVLWALAREISTLAQLKHAAAKGGNLGELMGRLRIWQSRQSLLRRALARYTTTDLQRLLRQAARADRAVKGLERIPAWESLTGLLLAVFDPRGHLAA